MTVTNEKCRTMWVRKVNVSVTLPLSRNSYTVAFQLGIKWHLTGIEEFGLSWQLFCIVMTTVIVTMLLLSNHIFII